LSVTKQAQELLFPLPPHWLEKIMEVAKRLFACLLFPVAWIGIAACDLAACCSHEPLHKNLHDSTELFAIHEELQRDTISLTDIKSDWFSLGEADQDKMLTILRQNFDRSEANDSPAAGYQVHFRKQQGTPFSIVLDKKNQRAKGSSMPMPGAGSSCSFCLKAVADERMEKYELLGKGQKIRVIQALYSGRPLTIPDEHIPHFFATDFAMQKQLVATANQARQIFTPGTTDYNIHFHVGSAGSQTVPHLHVRLA